MREGYKPPFPAWKAQLPQLVDNVVMAYFGVQSRQSLSSSDLDEVLTRFSSPQGPDHWDMASCSDDESFNNLIAIAYWPSYSKFDGWKQSSKFSEWWNSLEDKEGEYGYFLEIVSPERDNFETIFSDKESPEGVAWLAEGMGDEILEHGYWGSARDRLPVARTDSLSGTEEPLTGSTSGKRVIISGRDNLCLIRSGQDWSATKGDERDKYLTEIEPVLRKGMLYLRDSGHEVGCLNCRYMSVLDSDSFAMTDKTFGLAHFTDLAALERWSKSHPTHVAIFAGFMRYVKELNFNIALRLWHEIVVVPASAQHFEYINCHPKTGLLRQGPQCSELAS